MPWWISGSTTTSSGTGPYKIRVIGFSLDSVYRGLIYCHREIGTVEIITSPEGVEMTESDFRGLWREEQNKGDA